VLPFGGTPGYDGVYAGNGSAGYLDGSSTAAQFYSPLGVAVDSSGQAVYVADTNNHRIRAIYHFGVITLAGNTTASWIDGTGTAALFNQPKGVAVSGSGSSATVFVVDTGNYRIRAVRLDPATGSFAVSTLAGSGLFASTDGVGTNAAFQNLSGGISLSPDGSTLYIVDGGFIRQLQISSGNVTTIAGGGSGTAIDGVGTSARFKSPGQLVVAADGNIYLADTLNHVVRRISVPDYATASLAGAIGDSPGTQGTGSYGLQNSNPCNTSCAKFYRPTAIGAGPESSNPTLYEIDIPGTNRLRQLSFIYPPPPPSPPPPSPSPPPPPSLLDDPAILAARGCFLFIFSLFSHKVDNAQKNPHLNLNVPPSPPKENYQEQLNSKDQFTIPSALQEKMDSPS
jgi:hypothetical protein